MEFARQIAALPPDGVRGTKRALNRESQLTYGSVFQHALALQFMRMPPEYVETFGKELRS
jgi:enoyl-CoA hydratase/carnithine racemase